MNQQEDKSPPIVADCLAIVKVDLYRNLYRVIKIEDTLAHLRLVHPNRDVVMTLPVRTLIYQGANMIDYSKNYQITEKQVTNK